MKVKTYLYKDVINLILEYIPKYKMKECDPDTYIIDTIPQYIVRSLDNRQYKLYLALAKVRNILLFRNIDTKKWEYIQQHSSLFTSYIDPIEFKILSEVYVTTVKERNC